MGGIRAERLFDAMSNITETYRAGMKAAEPKFGREAIEVYLEHSLEEHKDYIDRARDDWEKGYHQGYSRACKDILGLMRR